MFIGKRANKTVLDKCEYCDKNNSFENKGLSMTLFIAHDKLIELNIQNNTVEHIDVNYCPMCSRKLKGD